MSNDIEIRLRFTESGLELIDQAGNKLTDFGRAASDAAGDSGGGGLKSIAKGMADVKAAWDAVSGVVQWAADTASEFNKMGVESLRAKAGFEAMGGSADTIKRMQDVTKGLVDDTLLLQDATHAMSSGAARGADDLVKIAQIGATLGITFRGDAATGVMEFTKAIEGVGNVRALRGLGIDVTAVKARLEDLKGTMSDSDAWRLAVMEVAGQNAKKLSGALDSTGTALERLGIRFEDWKEGVGESVAIWLEDLARRFEDLEQSMNRVADRAATAASGSVADVGKRHGVNIDNTYNEQATALYRTGAGGSGAYQSLVATYGQQMADEMMRSMGSHPAMLDQITQQSGGLQPYYARYIPGYGQNLNQYGIPRDVDIDMSLMDRRAPTDSPMGGDQAYWQRRRRASSYDTGVAGNDALRDEFVAPYEAAHKQATELATVKSILGDISGLAGDYHGKMMAVLAPLQEQQRLLEQRKSIQSVSDAFGLQSDGLYSEIGSGMSEAIATRRARYAEELQKRIGTGGRTEYASADKIRQYDEQAKAERDAYERSIGDPTAAELYKGGDYRKERMKAYDRSQAGKRRSALRRTKGKTYSKKDYERDLAQFDAESKEATDAYAIATGSATRESIRFNDQLQGAKKAYEEGKISLTQYKNELLLLGEAAKSGTTDMASLAQIQRRLNLDMRPGAKSDADKSVFDQYAGGVKTKGSASGAAGEKETGPFDAVVVSANKASAAAADIGTKGATAVGQLTIAGVLAAGSMGLLHGQTDNALQKVIKLQQQLNTLASLEIKITSTSKGGSDNTTRPARGMR